MSVCVEVERGDCLVTDNPENTFIHSDFHTINHGIIVDCHQSNSLEYIAVDEARC